MKFGLIMENWRRYKTLEDEMYLLENRKVTYETLLMKLEMKQINPDKYFEVLEYDLDERLKLCEELFNEAILLHEGAIGWIKDKAKKWAVSIFGAITGAITKTLASLKSLDIGIGTRAYLLLGKGIKLLAKLKSALSKLTKFLGPAAKYMVAAGILMLIFGCSTAAAATGTDISNLIDTDTLNAAKDLLASFAEAQDPEASYDVINQVSSSELDINGNTEQFQSLAQTVTSGEGTVNKDIVDAIDAIDGLIALQGDTVDQQQMQQALSEISNNASSMAEEAVRHAAEICGGELNDPEVCQQMSEHGEKVKIAVEDAKIHVETTFVTGEKVSADGTTDTIQVGQEISQQALKGRQVKRMSK
jgi:hypothetical protein